MAVNPPLLPESLADALRQLLWRLHAGGSGLPKDALLRLAKTYAGWVGFVAEENAKNGNVMFLSGLFDLAGSFFFFFLKLEKQDHDSMTTPL